MEANAAAIVGSLFAVMCFVLVVVLIILIFYLLTLQKALERVSPRNRLMEPGLVWLMLVPLLNIVWSFFVGRRIPDSLRNEFRSRRQDDGSDYGKSIGLAQASLGVISTFLSCAGVASTGLNPRMNQGMGLESQFTMLKLIEWVVGLIGFILFIIFWVKISTYSSRLAAMPGGPYDPRGWDEPPGGEPYGRPPLPYEGGPTNPPPPTPPSDQFRPDDRGQFR